MIKDMGITREQFFNLLYAGGERQVAKAIKACPPLADLPAHLRWEHALPTINYVLKWYNVPDRIEWRALSMTTYRLTAVIEREGEGYMSLCPELDIASQGDTIEEARVNLQEALELFLESASEEEIRNRFPSEFYITSLEVAVG